MSLHNYKQFIYSAPERPGDVEAVGDFVIQPCEPWFSEAEQVLVRRSLESQLEDFYDCWLVIRDGGKPVSTLWFHLGGDANRTGIMGYALTDPEHRGGGLQSRNFEAVVELADKMGSRMLMLGTANP